jgi:hypothetical protein
MKRQDWEYTGCPRRTGQYFWTVIVSAILSKKIYMHTCSIPNGFRDRTKDVITRIKERQDALRRATRHVRVVKCIDVDGGIFEYLLY